MRLEVGWIFSNAANLGDPSLLIKYYHQLGLMKIYLELVEDKDTSFVEMSLSAISSLLKIGQATKG